MLGRLSLKTILIGGAVVAAAIPAALITILMVGSVRDSDIEEASARYELLAQTLAAEHDQILASHRRAVQILTLEVEAQPSLSGPGVSLRLARTRATYPAFEAIAVLDASGRIVASDPPTADERRPTAGTDMSGREWFRHLERSREPAVPPDVEPSPVRTSGRSLPIAAPVSDGSGGLRGATAAWVRLTAIQTVTDRIRFGRTGYAQLTTAQGKTLTHESPASAGERMDSSKLSIWPLVAAKSSGRIARYTGLLGDQRVAGFATVPEVGWKVWVSQAREEVEADLNATYRRLLIWTLLALAGAVTLAIAVAAHVSRPIRALRDAASAIAAGDTTRRVSPEGPSEVAELAQAFDGMMAKLTAAQSALETRLAETAALLAIARVIGGTLDRDEALRKICRELARLTGAGTVAAHLVDAERTRLDPVAAYHVPKHLLEVVATSPIPLAEQGFRETVFGEGRIAWSDDIAHDPRFGFPLFRAFPHQSGLIIPLLLESQVAGTLYLVWWQERRRFDDAELAILRAIGQQAGTLLRSAQLHEATERQAKQATKLYEVAGQLASSLDLDLVLDQVARTTLDLLGCDASGIYAHDQARGGLVLLRGLNLDPELSRDLVLQPGEGAVGRAFAERRPVWTRDRAADPAITYTPATEALVRAKAPRAFLAVPVASGEKVHGVLICHFLTPHTFTPSEVELFSILAAHTAIALERARLFHESESRRRDLGALVAVTQRITRGLDVHAVLHGIAEAAAELFHGEAGFRLVQGEYLVRVAVTSGGAEAMSTERRRVGDGISGRVAATGEPIVTRDSAADPRLLHERQVSRRSDRTRAQMSVPVRIGSRVLGTLSIYRELDHQFDADAIALAGNLADQAGIAIENSRLFAEAERRRKAAESFAEVGRDHLPVPRPGRGRRTDRRERSPALRHPGGVAVSAGRGDRRPGHPRGVRRPRPRVARRGAAPRRNRSVGRCRARPAPRDIRRHVQRPPDPDHGGDPRPLARGVLSGRPRRSDHVPGPRDRRTVHRTPPGPDLPG